LAVSQDIDHSRLDKPITEKDATPSLKGADAQTRQRSETIVLDSDLESDITFTESRKPKGFRYWLQRVSIGVACATAAIWLIFGGSPLLLAILMTGIAAYGGHEFYRAVRAQGSDPNGILGIFACILFQIAALFHNRPIFSQFLPIMLTFVMIGALLVELGKPNHHPISNLGTTVLGAIYVGWLSSFVIRLRIIEHINIPIHHTGSWLLFYVCAITWISDTGGLVTGYLLGRKKLAPAISPAKTWEGFIGGIIAGTVAGIVVGAYLHFPIVLSTTLSVLLAVCAPVGDLCESALKRNLGLKDFGTFFANHGGVLDRIDSILFTAPVAYYFLMIFFAPK